jgi:hypothetical protein
MVERSIWEFLLVRLVVLQKLRILNSLLYDQRLSAAVLPFEISTPNIAMTGFECSDEFAISAQLLILQML